MKKHEPAFPTKITVIPENINHRNIDQTLSGLTKREYFAAMALQGLLSDPSRNGVPPDYAVVAVNYTDALLKELAK